MERLTEATGESSHLRGAMGTGLLLFVSIFLACALGEFTLRLLGHHGVPVQDLSERVRAVDDPVLDYRYHANYTTYTGSIGYHYNSAGFRDIDHDLEKAPGIYRILVLGDSVTDGYGVEAPQMFSNQVRERLDPTYEVITIAMGGLNTPQEIHLLEQEGLQYEPDLVVLNFVLNDPDFFSSLAGAERYYEERDSEIGLLGISVDPRLKRALKASALVYFIKQRVEQLLAKETPENDQYLSRLWEDPENRKKVSDGFERLAFLRDSGGFDVLVMIWPVLVDFDDYAFDTIHAWVVEQARARGFEHVDLRPELARTGASSSFMLTRDDAFHPNAMGHEVAAEAFTSWLGRTVGAQKQTVPNAEASGTVSDPTGS
jgi:lysophospholipase L1-like esterase